MTAPEILLKHAQNWSKLKALIESLPDQETENNPVQVPAQKIAELKQLWSEIRSST